MALKVFSKRHLDTVKECSLSQAVRQRIWYLMEDCDPYYETNNYNEKWTFSWDVLPGRLKKEHGWQELRAYKSKTEWEVLNNSKEFVLHGIPRFVLDATELYFDLLSEDKERSINSKANPSQFQSKLNIIFEDANLSWRMLDGRILRVDSKWLEEEIHAKAAELLVIHGFKGALEEFQQARSDLSIGDYKGAIHAANLALESTIKSILHIEHEKPGALFRKLIESELVPDYHEGFLKAFEEHVLRSVAMARNFEKGVGHGQGTDVNDPPKSLADLAVNLSGVLILFLLKRHNELHPVESEVNVEKEIPDDDIPF